MRNLLALLATAVIVFAAVGWYLGWYKVQSSVPQDGHQSINVDVNNKKIKEDILRGEQRLHKAIEGNKLLLPLSEVAGNLRQGPEQAKDGVAIWAETTPRMASFKVFVGGLSGEYVILKEDDGKPVMGPDNIPVMLRKTVEIDYQIYGDEFYPGRDDVHELSQKWVMR